MGQGGVTRTVRAYCDRWEMLPRGGLVLCALSGGRDSMALLHLLSALAEAGGFTVAAAHFNHRLRPAAQRDEDFVRAWCRERGISLTCGGGDVGAFAKETGRSVEDAARTLRYRFLEETADATGAQKIATAHHRQDNAETVLLHLLRGTGLKGLAGIPPVRGRIVRPLLEVDRAEIDAYVDENHISYVEDETNGDTAYTRNRLRLEVLPLLEDISPGCTDRMARTAGILRDEEAYLRSQTATLLPRSEGGVVSLPASVLLAQDRAIRRRLVREMGERMGVQLSAAHVEAALGLGSGGCLDLPKGLRAVRRPNMLVILQDKGSPAPLLLREGEQYWGDHLVRLWYSTEAVAEDERTVVLDALLKGPLTLAVWDGRGRLAIENGSRTIKRLFHDKGIPPDRRRGRAALYLEDRCIAVFGVATDARVQQPFGRGQRLTVRLEKSV